MSEVGGLKPGVDSSEPGVEQHPQKTPIFPWSKYYR
jgi:hypothetical protein